MTGRLLKAARSINPPVSALGVERRELAQCVAALGADVLEGKTLLDRVIACFFRVWPVAAVDYAVFAERVPNHVKVGLIKPDILGSFCAVPRGSSHESGDFAGDIGTFARCGHTVGPVVGRSVFGDGHISHVVYNALEGWDFCGELSDERWIFRATIDVEH